MAKQSTPDTSAANPAAEETEDLNDLVVIQVLSPKLQIGKLLYAQGATSIVTRSVAGKIVEDKNGKILRDYKPDSGKEKKGTPKY